MKPPDNIYILAGYDGLIYDAGYGDKKTVKYLVNEIKKIENKYKEKNLEFKLSRVLPSHAHPDHFSGLKLIREYLGVKIVLTKKTAEIIHNKKNFYKIFKTNDLEDYFIVRRNLCSKIKAVIVKQLSRVFYRRIYGLSLINDPDEIIENNTEILINGESWKIFPSPGHAIDHISLYNAEKGILFSGDNVLRTITTWLGPPSCSVKDYVNSIETLNKLPNLKIILPAHGSLIKNPKERIVEILEHRRERTQQVLNLVNVNSKIGISPTDIVQKLYPNGKKFLNQVALGWVCLTLKILEEKCLIKRVVGKKEIIFFPSDKNEN
ncbi:MAG: MBL fold metallo-hydrolase [Promethearchaeota archaeon]